MDILRRRTPAFAEGLLAAEAVELGGALQTNPYHSGTHEFQDWCDGWIDGQRDDYKKLLKG